MKYDYEELKKKVELCKNTNLSDIDIDEINIEGDEVA